MPLVQIDEELMLNTEAMSKVYRDGTKTIIELMTSDHSYYSRTIHDPHFEVFERIAKAANKFISLDM